MSLKGKEICFTGALQTMTRTEAAKKAEAAGAIVKKTAVKTLDILVVGDGAGQKADKDGNFDVWDEEAFATAVSGKGKASPASKASTKKQAASPPKKGKRAAPESDDDEDDDDDEESDEPPAKKAKGKKAAGGPLTSLKGKVVCFTGALKMKRADATVKAEAAGATVKTSATKTVNVLVVGDKAGDKKLSSCSADCELLTEDEFVGLVGGQANGTKRKASTKKEAPAKKGRMSKKPADDEDEDEDEDEEEDEPAPKKGKASAKGGALKSLKGKTLCFTGTLDMSRAQATALAVKAGASVRSKVSGTTEVLVCGAKAGSKKDEVSSSCAVIDEKTFLKLAK